MEKRINAMYSGHIETVDFLHLMPSLGYMLDTISWNVYAFSIMFLEYNLRTFEVLAYWILILYYIISPLLLKCDMRDLVIYLFMAYT